MFRRDQRNAVSGNK